MSLPPTTRTSVSAALHRPALLATAALVASLASLADPLPARAAIAPAIDFNEVARDEADRPLYIVDLADAALAGQASTFAPDAVYGAKLSGQAVNLVKSMATQYGLEVRMMTSLTRLSFTAALSDAQRSALSADGRVVRVSPDILLHPSTPATDTTALWRDSATTIAEPPNAQWTGLLPRPSTPITPWGTVATTPSPPSASLPKPLVYVLDAGVGQHVGLNVVERVNGVVPTGNDCGSRPGLLACNATQLTNTVGCYTHATMVAGVIGANGTGGGTRGVYPGVNIVSVVIFPPPTSAHTCVGSVGDPPSPSESYVAQSLEWIGNNLLATHPSRPSVINLSYNWSFTSQTPIGLIAQIQRVTSMHPGALFVQAAGNHYKDASQTAYNQTSPNDGVLVVGAINAHGQPVVPLNGLHGFWKDVHAANGARVIVHEPGSNYGSAVEVWAPGDAILTTIGDLPQQDGTTLYSNYGYVSGTSLAAPHVAGMAAIMIASDPSLSTSSTVEAAIRGRLRPLGSHDKLGLELQMPTLDMSKNYRPSTPYAEMWISQQCYRPYFWPYVAGCTYLPEVPVVHPYGPDTPVGIVRNYGVYYRTNAQQLGSIDSKGDGKYACDVVWTDTGFETRVLMAATQRSLFGASPSDLGSTLPGTLYSTTCPSATVTLRND